MRKRRLEINRLGAAIGQLEFDPQLAADPSGPNGLQSDALTKQRRGETRRRTLRRKKRTDDEVARAGVTSFGRFDGKQPARQRVADHLGRGQLVVKRAEPQMPVDHGKLGP